LRSNRGCPKRCGMFWESMGKGSHSLRRVLAVRIAFHDYSTRLETVTDLVQRARGGMISSLFEVSDYLSLQGHEVDVISDIATPGKTRRGTTWLHRPTEEYDVLVVNRGIGDGHPLIRARRRVLWTHDLPHPGFVPEQKMLNAFSLVVFMSRYAERIWRSLFSGIGRSAQIPNGVNRARFYPREKDRGLWLYCSAPNRGLARLPFLYDCLRARLGVGDMVAFSNLASLHPGEMGAADEYAATYAAVDGSGVQLRDPVPQDMLTDWLGRAGLLLMPSDYPEICSNTILQALASGTPVAATGGLGSAGEWVRHRKNGVLTRWLPHDYMAYTDNLIREVERILEPRRHAAACRAAAATKILSWSEVGARWERQLSRLCC